MMYSTIFVLCFAQISVFSSSFNISTPPNKLFQTKRKTLLTKIATIPTNRPSSQPKLLRPSPSPTRFPSTVFVSLRPTPISSRKPSVCPSKSVNKIQPTVSISERPRYPSTHPISLQPTYNNNNIAKWENKILFTKITVPIIDLYWQSSSKNAFSLPYHRINKNNLRSPSSSGNLRITDADQSIPYYPAPLTIAPSADIVYHGSDHVMVDGVQLYNIYYGDFSNSNLVISTPNLVDYFADHIGGTPWYNILTAYYKNVDGKKIYVSNVAKFMNSTTVNPRNKTSFTQLDVQDIIRKQIISKKWIFDNKKAIFTFIFRGDYVTLGWLSAWCAYHSNFFLDGFGIIKYAVVGDASYSKSQSFNERCMIPFTPNGNLGGDSVVSYYAHEMAEVVTNYNDDAWFFDEIENRLQNENGDVCVGNYGAINPVSNSNIDLGARSFLIQTMFLPGSSVGCVMTNASITISKTFPTVAASKAPTVLRATASPSMPGDIEYHPNTAAKVMKGTVNLYNIYVGDIDPATKTLVDYFSSNVGSSAWFRILGSYYEEINGRKNFAADATSFRGSKSFNSTTKGVTITLDNVINLIKFAVSNTNGWQPDSNGIYTVIFRGDFSFDLGSEGPWPYNWCSYRNSFQLIPKNSGGSSSSITNIKYSIIGDSSHTLVPSDGSFLCQPLQGAPTANSDAGGDSIAAKYASNLASIITNPFSNSWYFAATNEDISSACNSNWDLSNNSVKANVQVGAKQFLLPPIWLRGFGCSLTASPNWPTRSTSSPTRTPIPTSSPSLEIITKPRNRPSVGPSVAPQRYSGTASQQPAIAPFAAPLLVNNVIEPTAAPSTSISTTRKPSTATRKPSTSIPTTRKPSTSTPTTRKPSSIYPTAVRSVKPNSVWPSVDNKSKIATSRPSVKPSSSRPTWSYDVIYHNGYVMMGTTNFYNIYVGAVDESTKSLVDYFAANIGGSAWYDVFTSYYQIRNGLKMYMSNSATLKAAVSLFPDSHSMTLSDRDIRTMLLQLLQSNALPTDFNGVYNVIFNGNFVVKSVSGEKSWPQDWCSYHSSFNPSDPASATASLSAIKYAVIGDPTEASQGSLCLIKSSNVRNNNQPVSYNNNAAADSIVVSYAREFSSLITNLFGGWFFSTKNGNLFDVGEGCAWNFGTYSNSYNIVLGVKKFLIQQVWLPGVGCVMSKEL